MFEILEHTADIGFRARGRSLAELFENAAQALLEIANETVDVAPRQEYPLAASGADRESLLVNWLSEVLYFVDSKQVAFHHCRIDEMTEMRETTVAGAGLGEQHDPARHRARLVVKGVTYHQLSIEQNAEGWCAEVYLDV